MIRHAHYWIGPAGGPHGYLWYLRMARERARGRDADGYDLKVIPDRPLAIMTMKAERTLRRLIWRHTVLRRMLAGDFTREFNLRVREWARLFGSMSRSYCRSLFECDFLFVHDTFFAERLMRTCPTEARRKLVLMTHAPTYYAHQIAGDILPGASEELLYEEPCVKALVQRELETMESARWVVWPCAEAQEGYPEWLAGTQRSNAFVETGVSCPEIGLSRDTLRTGWGVSPGQRVALFLGRPHPHKGFDRFVEWADLHKKQGRSDWVFVFGGYDSAGWRDLSSIRHVGYVADNGAAYRTADLVLFPNKYSYLDLGLLEALSLGARVAISPTGGHRYVSNLCATLPRIRDTSPEESWQDLENVAVQYSKGEDAIVEFVSLWEQRFSLNTFFSGHMRLVQDLLSN